jgi:hypothetical protein
MSIPLCSLKYLVYQFSVNTTNTTNNCFPLWLLQHASTHISHHQANFEPLNIFEFLLTVLFVSKAAFTSSGGVHPPLEVKAAPRQKAIHYLHMRQQPSKQKEL